MVLGHVLDLAIPTTHINSYPNIKQYSYKVFAPGSKLDSQDWASVAWEYRDLLHRLSVCQFDAEVRGSCCKCSLRQVDIHVIYSSAEPKEQTQALTLQKRNTTVLSTREMNPLIAIAFEEHNASKTLRQKAWMEMLTLFPNTRTALSVVARAIASSPYREDTTHGTHVVKC